MVEGNKIIATILSQINLVTDVKIWLIDSSAIWHIGVNKDAFVSYSSMGNEEELIYLEDSWTIKVLEKGKFFFFFETHIKQNIGP